VRVCNLGKNRGLGHCAEGKAAAKVSGPCKIDGVIADEKEGIVVPSENGKQLFNRLRPREHLHWGKRERPLTERKNKRDKGGKT